ncbi:cytochrome P450 3A24-like [Biomphalaria glabrata]|uniref:Cytochrome P450 3A24-like n=1 Tax=Biomphalaria glabrata TaxID=6526 RepID=A0A9W3AT03_BIOGL|nr:cytochrome P450 3A24-like [Biomphalaria glabrata]XP_055890416.1 cytochrome P450 3A24-like [Biomphalaria glabrata]
MVEAEVQSNAFFYATIAAVTVVAYVVYKRLVDNENWEKYGVKHGNLSVTYITRLRDGFGQLLKEHGDTVGLKNMQMMLVTKDLQILREVFVKDFSNFIDRPRGPATLSHVERSLIFLKGQDWRRVRHIVTPAYSTGKLKHIYKIIDERAKKLAQVLEDFARKDKLVPVKLNAGQFTGEVIARSAFGLSSDCQGGENDEFIHYCQKFFKLQSKNLNFLLILFMVFPNVQKFLVKTFKWRIFDAFDETADNYFTSTLRKSIQVRQEAEGRGEKLPSDLLQNFINARKPEHKEERTKEEEAEAKLACSGLPSDTQLDKAMSEEELLGQSLIIIFAGFETASGVLATCFYTLAKYPEYQEKVYEELKSVLNSDSPSYEELAQLTYTEQFINETLRLYPPSSMISRQAAETKTYGSVTIPKGAAVLIPIFSILTDPRYYPDPERFDPDRFSEENRAGRDPMTFIPFGYGPHLCIGMRLVYLQLKSALAQTVRRVRFELNDRTEPKLGSEPTFRDLGLLIPDKPFLVSVKPRN